jgi:hypothetical protein
MRKPTSRLRLARLAATAGGRNALPSLGRKLPECHSEQASEEQEDPGCGDGEVSLRNVVSISISTHYIPVGSAPSDGDDEMIKEFEITASAALRHFRAPSDRAGALAPTRRAARVKLIQTQIVDLAEFLLSGRHTSGDLAMSPLVGSGVDACSADSYYRPIRNAGGVRAVVDDEFCDAFASVECSYLNECRAFQCGFRK